MKAPVGVSNAVWWAVILLAATASHLGINLTVCRRLTHSFLQPLDWKTTQHKDLFLGFSLLPCYPHLHLTACFVGFFFWHKMNEMRKTEFSSVNQRRTTTKWKTTHNWCCSTKTPPSGTFYESFECFSFWLVSSHCCFFFLTDKRELFFIFTEVHDSVWEMLLHFWYLCFYIMYKLMVRILFLYMYLTKIGKYHLILKKKNRIFDKVLHFDVKYLM